MSCTRKSDANGNGKKYGILFGGGDFRKIDKLSESEKTKTIIHELMHIPKTFGGGFIHHDKVHERNVKIVFDQYITLKKKNVFYMLNIPSQKEIGDDKTPLIEDKIVPSPLKPNLAIMEAIKRNEGKWRCF